MTQDQREKIRAEAEAVSELVGKALAAAAEAQAFSEKAFWATQKLVSRLTAESQEESHV